MRSANRKSDVAGSSKNHNYYHPLQTLNDEPGDNDDEMIVSKAVKAHVPPVTILKCNTDQIHKICITANISDYSIRKISIGHKVFCQKQQDIEVLLTLLENKYEYFTYTNKSDRPYKALLHGLDRMDTSILKKKLVDLGLKCIDVKLVFRKNQNVENIIYVVYFEQKSITLSELKQKYFSVDHIRIKWNYQTARGNKITQCYNCQMFGHGSSRCKVKTFCANCAGTHKTAECTTKDNVKCANCHGDHRAMSPDCPSRQKYSELKSRMTQTRPAARNHHPFVRNYGSSFPNALNQAEQNKTPTWNQQSSGSSGDLFSIDEMKAITLDLISKLRNCKSKADQFEVITSLAFKFLV